MKGRFPFKDIIDMFCWFINLMRGFLEILGIDTKIIDDITGKLQEMV